MPSSTFHIWTVGCQMNVSDSERLGSGIKNLGLAEAEDPETADFVVLNTCVVRQSAEDTATGMLGKLAKIKRHNPDRFIAVMGCMVGADRDSLKRRFPQVDIWASPQQFAPILQSIALKEGRAAPDDEGCIANLVPSQPKVATFVPITHGCDKFCTFCIIPYRRGRETSRDIQELIREAEMLVQRGVKEITLLGQNVDSYGQDLQPRRDLADLLEAVHEVEGLERIRFLTSHPNDMSTRIIKSIADLPKVCEVVNLPFQAGDDVVLANMRRGYTAMQYLHKIDEIRHIIGDDTTITTDVIVGFPGETERQFQNTIDILQRVRFDKVHSAAYSQRPGTLATRKMDETLTQNQKKERHRRLDEIQHQIQAEKNVAFVGKDTEILIEGTKRGRLTGRNRNDKLIYLEETVSSNGKSTSLKPQIGQTIKAKITRSTPWSLEAQPVT